MAVLFFFNVIIVDLLCSVNFCCMAKWPSYTYIYTHSFFHFIFYHVLSQVIGFFVCLFSFFMAAPMACGNTESFNSQCWARDWTHASAAIQGTAVRFLTHCTTVTTPMAAYFKLVGKVLFIVNEIIIYLEKNKVRILLIPYWK